MEYTSLEDMQAWARGKMQKPVDYTIGEPENPYMLRWWIVPRNEMANVYLHRILRDDDDRALHDHPWDNTTVVLEGQYREVTPGGIFIRKAGDIVRRQAVDAHRLELIDGPATSLFLTGPKLREWGFHCPNGWVHWRDFTGGAHGELIGKGCD